MFIINLVKKKGTNIMELVKRSLSTWINAAILLTVGILIIVSGALLGQNDLGSIGSASDTLDAISMVLGIVLLVVGGLALVFAICVSLLAKKSFLAASVGAGCVIAFGISLVVLKYAANLILIVVGVLPYLLLVLGALVAADGIYGLVRAIKAKGNLVAPIISIVLGAAAITLGALCVGDDPVIAQNVQLIVFGIVVVLEACLMVLGTFVKTPDIIVVAKKESK